MTGLEDAVCALAATTHDTAWQQLQLRGELGDVAEAAEGSTALLGLADVRALLASSLAGRPTRASFRTGTLTVCTLVPMRSVPHRVVCLLGLDDGVFPRQSSRDGDDVLARDPWVGERDPRSEDRQLLPRRHLRRRGPPRHHLHRRRRAHRRTRPAGRAARRAARRARPHGVGAAGARVRDVVTTHHPLQPFDPRNFSPGRSHAAVRSASTRCRTPVRARPRVPRHEPAPLFDGPLACAGRPPTSTWPSCVGCSTHPARGFLRQRLGVAETRGEDEPADALPVELDSLEQWAVGERVLRDRLRRARRRRLHRASSGTAATLPPGPLGDDDAARRRAARSRACCRPRPLERDAPARVARRRRTARRRHAAHRHRRRRPRRHAALD